MDAVCVLCVGLEVIEFLALFMKAFVNREYSFVHTELDSLIVWLFRD